MIEFKISEADLAKVSKKLDKWQGEPLKKRTQKALAAGMKRFVGPLRSAAPQPGQERPPKDAHGTLKASIAARALKKRPGEMSAYAVGPVGGRSKRQHVAPHRHLVIQGHRMVTHAGREIGRVSGDPFVSRAIDPLVGQVTAFIDEQVIRLA